MNTKLLKIAELGERIKDIVIGTEGGEEQKTTTLFFSLHHKILH